MLCLSVVDNIWEIIKEKNITKYFLPCILIILKVSVLRSIFGFASWNSSSRIL